MFNTTKDFFVKLLKFIGVLLVIAGGAFAFMLFGRGGLIVYILVIGAFIGIFFGGD